MPCRPTTFIRGNFYHIYSRGDRKDPIFFSEKDYRRFLDKTEEYRKKYSIDIIAFCLLSNHFHLLMRQLSGVLVSKFIGVLLNSHARYSSIKHQLPPGHFFQGRFGAKIIDSPESLLQVSRYIHLNPVKEVVLNLDFTYKGSRLLKNKAIIKKARTYPWSSYRLYLNPLLPSPLTINRGYIQDIEKTSAGYRKFVEAKITDEDALNLESF